MGPPALHILDFTAALNSQATTEPQGRIKRCSIPSHLPGDLADECEPHPSASTAAFSQPGPIWAVDGVTRIPFL
jgi:hypothetical protein